MSIHDECLKPFNGSWKKRGLPPGTIEYVGEERKDPVTISVIRYNADSCETTTCPDIASIPQHSKDAVQWINLSGIHEEQHIKDIGTRYNIHPLILEDIVNPEQRPRFEDLHAYNYFVLRMIFLDSDGVLCSEQISLILTEHMVITFQETPSDCFDIIRDRLKANKGRLRRAGADYLAYALIDAIVDEYFVIIEGIEDETEALEEDVLGASNPHIIRQLRQLKLRLGIMRKATWPLREIARGLGTGDTSLFRPDTLPYLKDLFSHTVHVSEAIESMREVAQDLFNIHLSNIDVQMQRQMRVLTIMASIFVPLTFIAGVYGMNFKDMPELDWRYGYPAVLLLMASISAIMLIFFRRKKWL